MCRALYAPIRLLCLADQKVPAMDKLYFFVLQSERMIEKWIGDAEGKKDLLGGGLKDILEETQDEASELVHSDNENSGNDSDLEVSV